MFSPLNRITLLTAEAAVLSFLIYSWVQAVDSFELQLGSLDTGIWQAQGLRLEVSWFGKGEARFTLSAERFAHPALQSSVSPLSLVCAKGYLSDLEMRCDDGVVNLSSPILDEGSFPVRFKWQKTAGSFSLELPRLSLAKGHVAALMEGTADSWRLVVDSAEISVAVLWERLTSTGFPMPPMKFAGKSHGKISLAGDQSGLLNADWKLKFNDLSYSDPTGQYLAEGLGGGWQGSLKRAARGHAGRQSLTINRGAMLTPFFYLDPAGASLVADMAYSLADDLSELIVEKFHFEHPGVLSLDANGILDLRDVPGFTRLTLKSSPVQLEALYNSYLKPVLAADFFQKLSPSGRLQLQLDLADETRAKLELQGVNLLQGEIVGDSAENFRVEGLNGSLLWESGSKGAESILSWRRAELLKNISIGAARAVLQLGGNHLRLAEPLSLPVLDGSLQIERLQLEQTDRGPGLDFQGYITPVSMQLLSQALGWPPLAGQLSGMIPGVSYSEGVLQLRGMTLIQLFDGRILIKNLVLENVFAALPVLQANVEMADLDLKTLTSTFSFGKITGKLGGRIDALRLEDWKPVSFDARFSTPEDDPGPHRISQEAVDNISNLGGVGISGAVSRSFLSVFKEFGYDRLGISCRLAKGVCEMGGIEPAKQGYYLVKGGGIPRIDIIGFNTRTDWDVLLSKLKQIAVGGTPIIN